MVIHSIFLYAKMKKIIAIEPETFEIAPAVAGRSSVVGIIERGRGYVDIVGIRQSTVRWFSENLKLAARLPEVDRLVRTRDEGASVIIF